MSAVEREDKRCVKWKVTTGEKQSIVSFNKAVKVLHVSKQNESLRCKHLTCWSFWVSEEQRPAPELLG
jgi:hypothetical protein